MRRGRYSVFGCGAICAGVMILLALILPTDFWWFLLGAALVCAGIWLCRCS